jgi:hypothetical protein
MIPAKLNTNTDNLQTPIMSEEAYHEIVRQTPGEELAAQCNLPYAECIKAIDQEQRLFDTPQDEIWPAEGYTGPDLP